MREKPPPPVPRPEKCPSKKKKKKKKKADAPQGSKGTDFGRKRKAAEPEMKAAASFKRGRVLKKRPAAVGSDAPLVEPA
eukprot:2766508-Alexandrium_andersonii.AAC.1